MAFLRIRKLFKRARAFVSRASCAGGAAVVLHDESPPGPSAADNALPAELFDAPTLSLHPLSPTAPAPSPSSEPPSALQLLPGLQRVNATSASEAVTAPEVSADPNILPSPSTPSPPCPSSSNVPSASSSAPAPEHSHAPCGVRTPTVPAQDMDAALHQGDSESSPSAGSQASDDTLAQVLAAVGQPTRIATLQASSTQSDVRSQLDQGSTLEPELNQEVLSSTGCTPPTGDDPASAATSTLNASISTPDSTAADLAEGHVVDPELTTGTAIKVAPPAVAPERYMQPVTDLSDVRQQDQGCNAEAEQNQKQVSSASCAPSKLDKRPTPLILPVTSQPPQRATSVGAVASAGPAALPLGHTRSLTLKSDDETQVLFNNTEAEEGTDSDRSAANSPSSNASSSDSYNSLLSSRDILNYVQGLAARGHSRKEHVKMFTSHGDKAKTLVSTLQECVAGLEQVTALELQLKQHMEEQLTQQMEDREQQLQALERMKQQVQADAQTELLKQELLKQQQLKQQQQAQDQRMQALEEQLKQYQQAHEQLKQQQQTQTEELKQQQQAQEQLKLQAQAQEEELKQQHQAQEQLKLQAQVHEEEEQRQQVKEQELQRRLCALEQQALAHEDKLQLQFDRVQQLLQLIQELRQQIERLQQQVQAYQKLSVQQQEDLAQQASDLADLDRQLVAQVTSHAYFMLPQVAAAVLQHVVFRAPHTPYNWRSRYHTWDGQPRYEVYVDLKRFFNRKRIAESFALKVLEVVVRRNNSTAHFHSRAALIRHVVLAVRLMNEHPHVVPEHRTAAAVIRRLYGMLSDAEKAAASSCGPTSDQANTPSGGLVAATGGMVTP